MEVLIDCYFDKLFAELDRNELTSRHKRRLLVKFFSDVINSCAEAENLNKADVCERIVESALRYHNISLSENSSICMLGKFHNVLYVVAKLCYDWNLSNNNIVSKILNDIYYCEQTFERIFIGAIFGTRVTHFLCGWKSDFEDKEESTDALIYFMNHAVSGKLQYHCIITGKKRRFIDVPMESYGRMMALQVAVQYAVPDILLIILRYGASCETEEFLPSPIESLLQTINESILTRSQETNFQNMLICLKLLLRTVPVVYVRTPNHVAETSGISNVLMYEQYPCLAEMNIVPPERSGKCPPELMHLCRCEIRKTLNQNWVLPHGIEQLQLPKTLKNYLDLLSD